jgi:hypothetical protein
MSINSCTPLIIDAKDLIQINATMLAGILIFYTIPYITTGWRTTSVPAFRVEKWRLMIRIYPKPTSEGAVLTLIAISIILFITSVILTFAAIFPPYISYWFSVGGFISIGAATIIFIKVIEKVKVETSKKKAEEKEEKEEEKEYQDFGIDENQVPTAASQPAKMYEEKRQKEKGSKPV